MLVMWTPGSVRQLSYRLRLCPRWSALLAEADVPQSGSRAVCHFYVSQDCSLRNRVPCLFLELDAWILIVTDYRANHDVFHLVQPHTAMHFSFSGLSSLYPHFSVLQLRLSGLTLRTAGGGGMGGWGVGVEGGLEMMVEVIKSNNNILAERFMLTVHFHR